MNDNPYQSPQTVPESEKRPRKHAGRVPLAVFGGVCGFMGSVLLLVHPLEYFLPSVAPLYMVLLIFLLPGTVGLTINAVEGHISFGVIFPVDNHRIEFRLGFQSLRSPRHNQ